MNKKFFIISLLIIFVFAYANFALAICGDGVPDAVEQCDGTTTETCASQGYASGTLGCYPSTDTQGFGCKFDVTGCVGSSTNFVSVQDGVLNAKDLFVGGNVGIGTTTPSAKLDVVGGIRTSQIAGMSLDMKSYNQVLGNGDKWGYQIQQINDASHDGYDMIFNNWGDNAGGFVFANSKENIGVVKINSNGNVGIGTSNPQARLNVVGDVNITGNIYVGGGTLGGNSGSGGFWNSTGSAGDIYYNSGKIGIGTNTPGALVDVFGGNIALRGPSGITPRLIFGESIVDSSSTFNFYSFSRPSSSIDGCDGNVDDQYRCSSIEVRTCADMANSTVGSQTAYFNRTVICVLDTNTYSINNNEGTLAFIDNDGNNNLVVKQGGKVGIGTSDPQSKLNVVGDVNITGNAYIHGQPLGAGGGVWLASTTPGDIYYTGGKVGIGTSKPLEKLDVSGNVRISGSGEATTIQVGFDVPEITSVVESGAGNLNSGTVCYKVGGVYSSGESLLSSEKCTNIVDNKKVTINWTRIAHATGYNIYGRGPTTYLKINSQLIPNPTSGNIISIDDVSGVPLGNPPVPSIPSGGLATAGGMVIGGDLEVKGNIIGASSSGGNSGWTADATKTTTNLNVGIGTSTIDSGVKLQVNGGQILINEPSGDAALRFKRADGKEALIDYDSGSKQMEFRLNCANAGCVGDSSKLLISDAGNVGIGTTTPSAKLDVVGGIRTSQIAGMSLDMKSYNQVLGNGDKWGYQIQQINDASHDGYDMIFNNWGDNAGGFVFANSKENIGVVKINSNGNVGIGTTNPTTKVDIYGGDLTLRSSSGNSPSLIFGQVTADTYGVGVPGSGPETCKTPVDNDNPYQCLPTETKTCVDVYLVLPSSRYQRDVTCVADSFTYRISNANGNLRFINNAGTGNLVIDQSGNVGIGTANPEAKLDVQGNIAIDNSGNIPSSTFLRLSTVDINKGMTTHSIFANANNGGLYIGVGQSADGSRNDFTLLNYNCFGGICNVPRIALYGDTVYADGNVGIGAITPLAKLDVNGDLKVTNTNKGASQGTQLCIGSNNIICKCGQCA